MPTNLAIDDELIEQARRAGEHKTKKDAVTVALQEYIKMRRRRGLLDLEGQVEFCPVCVPTAPNGAEFDETQKWSEVTQTVTGQGPSQLSPTRLNSAKRAPIGLRTSRPGVRVPPGAL